MPAQKSSAHGTPEASGRRRSGRISASGQKSKYFEGNSDVSDDDSTAAQYYGKPSTGSSNSNGKKRGRPAKKAGASKKAKLASSDDEHGDDYAEEHSDAEPGSADEEDDEDDDDDDDDDAPPRVTITPLVKLRETGGVPYEDTRLHKNTLLFLKDLKANNKRTWLKCNIFVRLPCSSCRTS